MSDCRCTRSESLTVKFETQGQFPYCHVVTAAGWATLGCCLILHIWHSLGCLFAMQEFRLMIIIFEEGIKRYGTPPYCKNYWPRKAIPPRAYYNRAMLNAANFTSCFRNCIVVVCGFIVCLQVVESSWFVHLSMEVKPTHKHTGWASSTLFDFMSVNKAVWAFKLENGIIWWLLARAFLISFELCYELQIIFVNLRDNCAAQERCSLSQNHWNFRFYKCN